MSRISYEVIGHDARDIKGIQLRSSLLGTVMRAIRNTKEPEDIQIDAIAVLHQLLTNMVYIEFCNRLLTNLHKLRSMSEVKSSLEASLIEYCKDNINHTHRMETFIEVLDPTYKSRLKEQQDREK